MSTPALVLDRAITPLDAARRGLLHGLLRHAPPLGRLVVRRDDRVLLQATVGIATTFALTMLCPAFLFVLGPALFGVAHVASDVRYLVLRRALPRAWIAFTVVASLALVSLRVIESIMPGRLPFALVEVSLGWTWALAGLFAGWVGSSAERGVAGARGAAAEPGASGARSGGPSARATWLVLPLVGCAITAITHPVFARIVFAHAHNLVALVLWAALFRRRLAFALPVLALAIAGAAMLASGSLLASTHITGAWGDRMVEEMVFGWPRWVAQRTALGLGMAYVFLQALHYNAWLAWIPQDDTRSEGTLSFRMSARSLVKDFGPWMLGMIVLSALAVIGASFVDVHRTRHLYLSLASFHGYLELAAGAYLFARGATRPGPA